MESYKWAVILDPMGLRSRFKIGDLVQCVSKSDGELIVGSWISYGEIGIVKRVQFFKRERMEGGEPEVRPYPPILCEIEVFWMHKNESAWVLESLLQPLEM